jgi:hypothetical protein
MKTNQITFTGGPGSQRALPENKWRSYLSIQNQSATETMVINIGRQGSGGSDGEQILPGQFREWGLNGMQSTPEEEIFLNTISGASANFFIVEGTDERARLKDIGK